MKLFIQLLKRYQHINWALTDQAMVSGVNFLTGILFARFLGIEEYGRFTLAWMSVLFFNSFQQAAIVSPMMSLGPKQPQESENSYYSAVFIQLSICLIFGFLIFYSLAWLINFLKPEWHVSNLSLPLSISLLTWNLQDFIRRYFFVRGLCGHAFLNDAISYLGQLLLLLLMFHFINLNTTYVLWIISSTSAFASCVGFLKIGILKFPIGNFSIVLKKNWHFSKWLIGSALMQWTTGNAFLVAAGSFIGASAVGGIRAAQNVVGVINIIFNSTDMLIHSGASRSLYSGGIKSLKEYISTVTIQGTCATLGILFPIFIFSKHLLYFIYGNSFLEYSFIVKWFCIINIFSFIGYPLSAGLRSLEKTRMIFISIFLTGIFSLIFAKLLISLWDIIGVMIGYLLVKIIMVSLFSFELYRSFRLIKNKY